MQPEEATPAGVQGKEVKFLIAFALGLVLLQFALFGAFVSLTGRVSEMEETKFYDFAAVVNQLEMNRANQPDWRAAKPYVRAWITLLKATGDLQTGRIEQAEAIGIVVQTFQFDPDMLRTFLAAEEQFGPRVERALWEALLGE